VKRAFIALFALAVCACAAQKSWIKPGANDADFAQDKYGCMQQSQQRVSNAFVNQYGGAANNSVITNGDLFGACMNSRGWTLVSKEQTDQLVSNNQQAKAATDALDNQIRDMCDKAEFRPYYSKTACKPEDTTLDQMADKSRITAAEKIALNKARLEVKRIASEYDGVLRQYYPQVAPAIVARRESTYSEQDKLALELYEGQITWGGYNTRRSQIAKKLKDDLAAMPHA
jgi:hypothetical protein